MTICVFTHLNKITGVRYYKRFFCTTSSGTHAEMDPAKFILFLSLCLVSVKSMAINGPALTRYDPCGLGVILFDRMTNTYWQGAIHLGLYKHLREVEIEITFENKVTIAGASHNSTLVPSDEGHKLLIKPKGFVPKTYLFYINIVESEQNDTAVPIVSKFSLNNIVLCDDKIKINQTLDSLNAQNGHICGRKSLDHTEVVSVRTEALAGDWPWHVAIYTKDPGSTEATYYCGGNIISETAIVTAGHCVRYNGVGIPPDSITVIAGVNNHKDVSQVGRQSLPVKEVVLHPDYDDELASSDLAILKVDKLKYTAYVQPICVWGPVYDKPNVVGRQGTVVGFGRDSNNKPSDVLRSTYIQVQNDTTCLTYSPSVYTKLINEFTLCAGYGPKSGINPRNGDSGGGLVFPVMQPDHKVSWFLRGVLSKCGVSPGQTSCDPSYYVVYTDVAPHYGWIYHHSGLIYSSNVIYNNP